MRYLKQFFIILCFSFAGEVLHYFIPLPVPASIYGMVLLFAALCIKAVRLDDVRETGKFLIKIMPVMFLPAAVGIMNEWSILKPVLLPVIVIMIVSLIFVMGISARVTQAVNRAELKKQKRKMPTSHDAAESGGISGLAEAKDGGEKNV